MKHASLHKIPVSLHVHSTPVSQMVCTSCCLQLALYWDQGFLACLSLRPHEFSYLLLQNATEGHSTTENTGIKNVKQIFFIK